MFYETISKIRMEIARFDSITMCGKFTTNKDVIVNEAKDAGIV